MKEEWDQDKLWDLLGHAKPVSVSPFFPRRVLRDVRLAASPRPLIPMMVLRWLGAGALAVLTAGFFLNLEGSSTGLSGNLTKSADFTEVFDAAAGLDTLVAVEDVSLANYTSDL